MASGQEGGAQVDIHNPVPNLETHVDRASSAMRESKIVYDDLQPAKGINGRLGAPGVVLRNREIPYCADGVAAGLLDHALSPFSPLRRDVGDSHPGTLGGEE